jgi:hypothetical protein
MEQTMDFSGMMGRPKEMVPKPRPEVNLSFDEYVNVLYGIVEQCAKDVCQSDEMRGLSGNGVDAASAHKREIGVAGRASLCHEALELERALQGQGQGGARRRDDCAGYLWAGSLW